MKLEHNTTLSTNAHFSDKQESGVKQTQSNPSDVARFNSILKEKTEKPATSSGKSAPTQEKIISALKKGFTLRFEHAAKDSKSFHALLNQAFGSSYDHEAAETIRHKATQGDFSWLPDTKIVSGNEFADAQLTGGDTGSFLGAFDGDSVILNQEVLSDSNLAKSVYAEEVGHALDKIVNKGADAEGDEGAIFQKSLFGEKISADQLTALKSENDHGVLGGREVEFDKLIPSFQPSIYMREDDMKRAFEHGGGLEGIYNHWQKHGINEGRRASIEFDVQYYLSQNADLEKAFGKDYKAAHDHWLQNGLNEGRRGSDDFDAKYYLEQNADLKATFGTDYKAALQHWLEFGIKEGRAGSIKSDMQANLFAVAYQNMKQGVKGAAEDLETLKQTVANKDQGEVAKKALEAIVTKITDRNSTMDKAGLDAAIAAYDKDIAKSKAGTHLMADVSRLVKLVTYNVATKDAAGHEGAQARKTSLLKSLADKDITAFNKAASAILEKNPDVTVERIDGDLATWYAAHKYAGKADENATVAAFNAFVTRAKVEAHFRGDIRRIVALAANNETAGIEGAKEVNVALRQSIIDQDNEAFNQAATKVLALRPGPEITKEWIDTDLTNWYGATDYEGKAEVDAATTAFIARREAQTHFMGNIDHIIALATQNDVEGLDGAKERKAELLKSIVDKDNTAVAKVGQEILAQNPELTVEIIDGTVAWHKDYVTQIQDAQKHLMSDAKRAVALAAHNEINGVEGAHARSEALKESLANKDVAAFNKVIAEIVVENPHLSVKWIDGDLATWHAETEYADKAAIDATATAFNASIARTEVEAHFMGDIRRIVALAANNEVAGIEGAKEATDALNQSIVDQDNKAFNKAMAKVLELRPGPEITKEWIDGDLTNWYAATDYEGKAEVDAATTAFIERREVQAYFMADINHVAAIALQNEVAGLPGAQEDYDALREAALAKDQAAIDKASLKIFARSPDLTIESIDDAVSKGNDLLQNA